MKNRTQAPPGQQRHLITQLLSSGFAFFWLVLIFSVSNAQAATPAGTQISNSAAATYLDSAGIERTVTSNTVITEVQQVASVTLEQDLAYTVNPGGEVTYPVTLTNTGNGTDSFTLAATANSGGFTLGSVVFYADSNGDGIADNSTPITTTPPLAPGAVFYFVASATAPLTATSGQSNTLVITGTSAFKSTVSDIVTETTTVTDNAVINVTKTMSSTNGIAGSGPYTVTLTYRNEGNKPATAVKLLDALPSGMTYVPNSGRWSVTGNTVLTDAVDGTQGTSPTMDYSITGTTVTGTVNTVAVGQAGTLTFQVSIAANAVPSTLANTASYEYNDGVSLLTPKNTNTVNFQVTETSNVTFDGPTPIPSAPEGGVISFNNLLTNTGNSTDTFDITVDSNTFPAGSTYVLYQNGGVVPLVDSNKNGIPDTGPVAAQATYTVVLKVTLPTNVTATGPFDIVKKATSANDPTKQDTATDTLTAVTQSAVDLTNNTAVNGSALGEGVTTSGEAAPVVTNTTTAGTTTRFTLFVNNTGPNADSYNLSASTDNTFAGLVLPTGWAVVFHDSAGNVVTSTGTMASGSNKQIFADVSIPAGQTGAAALQSIYFQVLSPTSLSKDIIHDAVQLTTSRSLSLIAENTGQVAPGASKIYVHTLTNTGNATEDVALNLTSSTGFLSVVYKDVNNNGVIDAGDILINTADAVADFTALAPGAVVNLLVKVTADANTPVGTLDTTTLKATATLATVTGVAAPTPITVIDTTRVVSGNIVLFKEQALDTNCNGIDGAEAFSASTITANAVPGACIVYRITATNNGTANVTNVVISDNTPAYTTYDATPAASSTLGTVSAPANGVTGAITATIPTLTPSASAELIFGVKID